SMQSEHSSLTLYSRKETLAMWQGQRPAANNGATPTLKLPIQVNISDEAVAIQAAEAVGNDGIDPKLKMLIAMIEAITGKRIKLLDAVPLTQPPTEGARQSNAPAEADWGLEYDLHES